MKNHTPVLYVERVTDSMVALVFICDDIQVYVRIHVQSVVRVL